MLNKSVLFVKDNGITPGEEDEFSFYRFSVLHFQGDATHTHITQRLREPLLHHHDEGDALVRPGRRKVSGAFGRSQNGPFLDFQACLSVWCLILRFMEDLPEPTSPETPTKGLRPVSRNLPMRQGMRLNNVPGLEEV